MAPELHAELAGAAERAGTSLNQFINDVLASAVGTGDRGAEDGQGERRVSRSVAFALVANVVVVGVAAAAAIVLIVLALTS
jgi:hypothetical protein